MKRIVVLAAFLVGGAMLAAPTAGATPVCAPGVAEPLYCTAVNASGVVLSAKTVQAIGDRLVEVPLRCEKKPHCAGTLSLLAPGQKLGRHASVYGQVKYSIPFGGKATVKITINRLGQAILKRKRKLTVQVVAVFSDPRTAVIGTLTIRASGQPKHVTQVKVRPGFTG